MGYSFTNLDGTMTNMNIKSIDYPRRSEANCRSNAQYRFGVRLEDMFRGEVILEEFSLPKMGGLSLDFFMPRLRVAFEIDGRQHESFVPYMHGDREGFRRQRVRDDTKRQWCELNQIKLIHISDQDVDYFDILGAMSE